MGIIEVMVAMAIGLTLIAGATQVYMNSRKTYETNETIARLQETARFAIGVIEPDIRQANFWGLLKVTGTITGKQSQTAAPDSSVSGTTASTQCGTNYAIDLDTSIEGSNNAYSLACAAFQPAGGGGAVTSADTLTVRRAAVQISSVAPTNTTVMRICSSRTDGQLVKDVSGCPTGLGQQVNDLVVNTYYVDQDSDERNGIPSLRRWSLTNSPLTAAPSFVDNEIITGVEDMQVQFGIDPTGTGGATQYVDAANAATLNAAQVIAVRIWLLVRAENPEVGFVDKRTYVYGDRLVANGTTTTLNSATAGQKAYAPGDGYHRLLVSRTIMIRNESGT